MTKKRPPNQWQPGQTGNPKGRPPGQSEITRLRSSLAEHVPSIVDQLVTAAKAGDVQAARLILERILPPVKAIEQAVELQLPEGGTLTAKAAAVLSAAAAGLLAPTQAAQLIAALGTVAKITEVDELAARITALENKHALKT
jgi:polyhydroxyalkanoate synthesis regulator phasin